jgi:hypothetical protein
MAKILFINNEYRLTNFELRSGARRRPTLLNSKFVNRYSLFKKWDFTPFHAFSHFKFSLANRENVFQ